MIFDRDFMNPFIGVIVEIEEPSRKFSPTNKRSKGQDAFILEAIGAFKSFIIWCGDDVSQVLAFAESEFVIILMLPTHGALQGGVKLSKGIVCWHAKAAPDHGSDFVEGDFYGEVLHGIVKKKFNEKVIGSDESVNQVDRTYLANGESIQRKQSSQHYPCRGQVGIMIT